MRRRDQRSPPAASLWRTPRARSLLGLLMLGLILLVLDAAVRLYTDILWYREIGEIPVLWTTLKWRLLAGAATGLGTASFVLVNLGAVERTMARDSGDAGPGDGLAAQLWRNRRLLRPLLAVACGVIAIRLHAADDWRLLALW